MSNTRSNPRIIDRLLSTDDSAGALILRVSIGLVFLAHGAQKLFGWFGGHGLAGTGQFFDSVGLQPGLVLALLAGATEFFGGLALVAGLLVRPAAAALAFAMAVAAFAVHWDKGFFVTNGGYEYALTLAVASLSLLASGGGRYSLDGWLRGRGRAAKTWTGGVPNLGASR
jgi:putative oxidoreductase